jgi:hypothetical protein
MPLGVWFFWCVGNESLVLSSLPILSAKRQKMTCFDSLLRLIMNRTQAKGKSPIGYTTSLLFLNPPHLTSLMLYCVIELLFTVIYPHAILSKVDRAGFRSITAMSSI